MKNVEWFFPEFWQEIRKKFHEILLKFWNGSGAKECKSCSSRKMLQILNAYLGAKIGFDAEENEPSKVWWFGWKIGVKFGIGSFNLGPASRRASRRAGRTPFFSVLRREGQARGVGCTLSCAQRIVLSEARLPSHSSRRASWRSALCGKTEKIWRQKNSFFLPDVKMSHLKRSILHLRLGLRCAFFSAARHRISDAQLHSELTARERSGAAGRKTFDVRRNPFSYKRKDGKKKWNHVIQCREIICPMQSRSMLRS